MRYYSILFVIPFLSACVSVGSVKLAEDNLMHLEKEVLSTKSNTVPLIEYNSGIVADFEKESIGNWWGSNKILLTKKKGNLVVNAVGVGKEYDRFGYNFVPRVDFTETNILRVKVRAKGDKSPTLRIDLKDGNGYVTNSQDSKARLILCDDYVYYYYRYEGRFRQSWPFHADVNPSDIMQLEIFINPGGENFTGQLIIDEIVPVTEEQMWNEIEQAVPACNVPMPTHFNNDIKTCWSNSDVYSLEKAESALLVKANNAGSNYESFGYGFTMSSLTDHPKVIIKAKVVGSEAAQLRVDLIDFSGFATNGHAQEFTVKNDGIYREYTFNFVDKLFQGWPTSGKVNSNFINELMIFLNPGGPAFTGDLYIDEIRLDTSFSISEPMTFDLFPMSQSSLYNVFDASNDLNTWWSKNGSSAEVRNNKLFMRFASKGSVLGTGIDPLDVTDATLLVLDHEMKDVRDISLTVELMDSRGERSLPITQNSNKLSFNLSEELIGNSKMNLGLITSVIISANDPVKEEIVVKGIEIK